MSPFPEPPSLPSPPKDERSDFGSFYGSLLTPLRDYVARFTGNRDEAQDIAQDAFLKTYQAMTSTSIAQPRAYLYAAARRLALNFYRRRAARTELVPPADFDLREALTPTALERALADEDDALFAAAVSSLPSDLQKIIVLRLVHHRSPKEIAAELNFAVSTVWNKLGEAMHRVREQVAQRNALNLTSGRK